MPPTLWHFLPRMVEPPLTLPEAWPQPEPSVLPALAYGGAPEDFVVEELGGPAPGALTDAHHLALWVEKRGRSTGAVAAALAAWRGCAPQDVGFAGQKDRQALTRQWFTVPRAVAEPLPALPEGDGWRALGAHPTLKKWRRGDHAGNAFTLRLELPPRVRGDLGALAAAVEERLAAPVPNYFGPQRFGAGGGNLKALEAWRAGAPLPRGRSRGFLLSAARAYVFNLLLAARVQQLGLAPCDGDHLDEAGVPTAPLWGRGRSVSAGAQAALEAAVLAPHRAFLDALEHTGVRQDRRPLALRCAGVHCEVQGETALSLALRLPPGCYATTALAALGPATWMPAEAA